MHSQAVSRSRPNTTAEITIPPGLAALTRLPQSAGDLRRRRRRLVVEIHREQLRLRSHFERYYRPVQDFLRTHSVAASEHFRLTFSASIVQSGLSEPLLSMINQRRVGPFEPPVRARELRRQVLSHAHHLRALPCK